MTYEIREVYRYLLEEPIYKVMYYELYKSWYFINLSGDHLGLINGTMCENIIIKYGIK